jgi:predicted esterase
MAHQEATVAASPNSTLASTLLIGGTLFHLWEPAPVIVEDPRPAPPRPLILCMHGRTGSHRDHVDFWQRLAVACGGVVAAFDLPNHGVGQLDPVHNFGWTERRAPSISSPPPAATAETPITTTALTNPHHAMDMYSQMVAAHQIIALAIDLLPTFGVHFEQVAVVGISQGGHAALLAFTHQPRIDICLNIIGAGDYIGLMDHRLASTTTWPAPPPDPAVLVPPALRSLCARLDPLHNLAALLAPGRVLHILHGDADPLVPITLNRKLLAALDAAAPSHACHLHVYPGVGHRVTEAMMADAIQYLQAALTPPAQQSRI